MMNQLTKAKVEADDRLFVTLDATSRLWHVDPVLKIVLTDTVGFIRKLPHDLVASFRSTLTEVREADLLFHVIDASHRHREELKKTVEEVIASLVEAPIPTTLIFNKIDALSPLELKILMREHPEAIFISALNKTGLDDLRNFAKQRFSYRIQECNLFLPFRNLGQFYRLGQYGQILNSAHLEDGIHIAFRGFKERIEALRRDIPELREEPALAPAAESS